MRLLLPITVLAACVEASKRAGAYTTMFLWNSYQIEIEAFGAGKTITAPGCNTERPCTFDEFIKYIVRGKPGLTGPTDIGPDSRELPVVHTAEKLKKLNYNTVINYQLLYPIFKDVKDTPNLSTLLGTTMEAIQQARQATTKPDSIKIIDKLQELAKQSLDGGIKMRQVDMQEYLIRDLKKWLEEKSPKFKLQYENPDPVMTDGTPYKVDMKKSLEANKDLITDEFTETFDGIMKGRERDEKGQRKRHAAAIGTLQDLVERLGGSAPATSCPK